MDDDRRSAIIRLLETRDDRLPHPVRRSEAVSGFVNEPRERTCPDCLANGRVMFGCETCGGSGSVSPSRLGRVAAVDELPDDGQKRDPYAKNETVGFDLTRHDAKVARDREIAMLEQQTRPPRTEAELLAEANRRGYAWEEERKQMYRRFDYAALDRALDELRNSDLDAYHALHLVYVYDWIGTPSALLEVAVEHGLLYLGDRLPDPVRAPGFVEKHPALERRARKAA